MDNHHPQKFMPWLQQWQWLL